MQVKQLGEQALLKRLQAYCPADVVGDDAALLRVAAGYELVVTTDMLIDGLHFSERTTSAEDAGWRAAAANLSDLAAMGAEPLGITVGLSLPGELEADWVEGLYRGMSACLRPLNAAILGGDICRSSVIAVSITALGQVRPEQAIRRNAAQVGDVVMVTGAHGASRAGLELLLHPEQGQGLTASDRAMLIRAHQRPQPRLDVAAILREIGARRVAGMDSSDGLADAVLQICRASQVGARLERNWIPVPACLTAWISEAEAIDWALYGGEDFELVLCLPRPAAQSLVERLGSGAAIVGSITAEPDVLLRDQSGLHPEQQLSLERGFQHF